MPTKKIPQAPLSSLRRWYLAVCLFTLRLEVDIEQLETQLADIERRFSIRGWTAGFQRRTRPMRRIVEELLDHYDARLGVPSSKVGATARLAPGRVGEALYAAMEENMSDIVRDLDLRAILGSLIASGRHEHDKVDEVVDLTLRYAEELDRRRSEARPADGRPPGRRR